MPRSVVAATLDIRLLSRGCRRAWLFGASPIRVVSDLRIDHHSRVDTLDVR
jgi:hypothetical protein